MLQSYIMEVWSENTELEKVHFSHSEGDEGY